MVPARTLTVAGTDATAALELATVMAVSESTMALRVTVTSMEVPPMTVLAERLEPETFSFLSVMVLPTAVVPLVAVMRTDPSAASSLA